MSYIISEKQLDTELESRPKYIPYLQTDLPDVNLQRKIIISGHPTYDWISDCFEITSSKNGFYTPITRYRRPVEAEKEEPLHFPIIPDGCVSIVFLLSRNATTAKVCGTVTELRNLSFLEHDAAFVIRFLPGAAGALIEEPAFHLTDRALPAEAVIPDWKELLNSISWAGTFHERNLVTSRFFREKMERRNQTPTAVNHLVQFCVNYIFRRRGIVKISALAEETGYSQRYLSNVFDRWIGVSPKTYSEIIQLQWSLSVIRSREEKALINTALSSGYFDHAHMNRMYRRFLHCTAGTFKKKGLEASMIREASPYLI